MKKDPTRPQTDVVTSVMFAPGVSQRGNKTMRADWVTPYRKFSTWHRPEATDSLGIKDWLAFAQATADGTEAPETISYRKDAESGFYKILGFNREADHAP